jgi:hypothetical protein
MQHQDTLGHERAVRFLGGLLVGRWRGLESLARKILGRNLGAKLKGKIFIDSSGNFFVILMPRILFIIAKNICLHKYSFWKLFFSLFLN